MNIKRIYLYLAFVVYQVSAFIFTVMVDGHLDLLGLLKFIPWFKYISFLGVIMLVVDLIWQWMDRRDSKKRQMELEKENIELKAKVYDHQEAARMTTSAKQL
jgi:membrane protein implicated in regulation of membrane protease activity